MRAQCGLTIPLSVAGQIPAAPADDVAAHKGLQVDVDATLRDVARRVLPEAE